MEITNLEKKEILKLGEEIKILKDKLSKVQHEYDSTRGLWCIDKDPNKVDMKFIQENCFQLI